MTRPWHRRRLRVRPGGRRTSAAVRLRAHVLALGAWGTAVDAGVRLRPVALLSPLMAAVLRTRLWRRRHENNVSTRLAVGLTEECRRVGDSFGIVGSRIVDQHNDARTPPQALECRHQRVERSPALMMPGKRRKTLAYRW